ncbi:hypothetical protein ACOMHN_015859 [Nucella lapillus]
MENTPADSKTCNGLKPKPPPKPHSATVSGLARKLEDLASRFTQLEDRTILLDRDNTLYREKNNQLSAELTELRHLYKDHSQLLESHTKLLKGQHRDAERMNQTNLETKQRQLEQTLAELKLYLKTFQADHSKLLSQQESLEESQGTQNGEIANLRLQQQTHLPRVQELQTQQSDTLREMASLREEMTSQSRDLASIQEGNFAGQQPGADLFHQVYLQTLQSEVAALQAGQSQLTLDQNGVQTGVSSLQREQGRLREDMDTIIAYQIEIVQADLSKLTTDVETMRAVQETIQAGLTKLQKEDQKVAVLAQQRQPQQNQNTVTRDMDTVTACQVEVIRADLTKLVKDAETMMRIYQETVQTGLTKLQKEDQTDTVMAPQRQLQESLDTVTRDVKIYVELEHDPQMKTPCGE